MDKADFLIEVNGWAMRYSDSLVIISSPKRYIITSLILISITSAWYFLMYGPIDRSIRIQKADLSHKAIASKVSNTISYKSTPSELNQLLLDMVQMSGKASLLLIGCRVEDGLNGKSMQNHKNNVHGEGIVKKISYDFVGGFDSFIEFFEAIKTIKHQFWIDGAHFEKRPDGLFDGTVLLIVSC